jgi:hypothetical protein
LGVILSYKKKLNISEDGSAAIIRQKQKGMEVALFISVHPRTTLMPGGLN